LTVLIFNSHKHKYTEFVDVRHVTCVISELVRTLRVCLAVTYDKRHFRYKFVLFLTLL